MQDNTPNIGWVQVPPAIATKGGLSSNGKLLLGKIIGLLGNEGYCWATNKYLADSLGWENERKVQRVLEELEAKHLIFKSLLGSKPNTVRHIYLTKSSKLQGVSKLTGGGVKNDTQSTTHKVVETEFPTSTLTDENKQTLNQQKRVELSSEIIEPWHEDKKYLNFYTMSERTVPKNAEDFKNIVEELAKVQPKQGRSKKGLHPCTYEEIWEVAKELRLSISEVTDTHTRIIESINEGNKYKIEAVYPILRRWLKRDIENGTKEIMDDIQMISLDKQYHPIERRKRRFYEQLRKRREDAKTV